MKKLFLFVSAIALIVTLNSCSSDSDGGNSLSFKVNGVSKKFIATTVATGGVIYINGYIGDSEAPTERLSLAMALNAIGDNAIPYISYQNATDTYTSSTFTSNVSENENGKTKGTFSGTLESAGAGDDVVVTNGKFSVTY